MKEKTINKIIDELIKKYGMKILLEQLIKFCFSHKEQYMQRLGMDLKVALTNYENRHN